MAMTKCMLERERVYKIVPNLNSGLVLPIEPIKCLVVDSFTF
jgi:hypothetical protein